MPGFRAARGGRAWRTNRRERSESAPFPEHREAYVAPEVARIGTVEELTEGSVFNPIGGDAASIGN